MKVGKHVWREVPGESNQYYCIFPSTDEFYRAAGSDLEHLATHNRASRNEESGVRPWSGTNTWKEALELGSGRGWPEGASKMREMRARVNALHMSLVGSRRRKLIKPMGAIVHVPRFLAGDVNHMVSWKRKRTGDGTHVSFGVECGMLGFIGPDTAANRGIAVAALLKVVEDSGISVNLTALHTARARGGIMTCAHRVKQAGSYMNDERIAIALAHPATHRRGAFGIRELWDDSFNMMIGYGYGCTRPTPEKTLKQMGIDHHITTIHNDSMDWNNPTDKDMVDWVLRQFEAICTAKNIRAI